MKQVVLAHGYLLDTYTRGEASRMRNGGSCAIPVILGELIRIFVDNIVGRVFKRPISGFVLE
jgi:hypothetical protein